MTVQPSPAREFYSPAQAAELLGCSAAHVRHLIAEHELVAANIGAAKGRKGGKGRALWCIPRSELGAMLKARGLKDLPWGALGTLDALDATGAHAVATGSLKMVRK